MFKIPIIKLVFLDLPPSNSVILPHNIRTGLKVQALDCPQVIRFFHLINMLLSFLYEKCSDSLYGQAIAYRREE